MSAVTVLGAGPAGLVAALEAAEAGHQVTLIDQADNVGGMSASFEVDGQRVDFGSHRLHPATNPALMQRLQNLLGDDLQQRERNGRIRLRGRWVGFPLRITDMARSLPLDFTAQITRDMLTGPMRRTASDSFADQVRGRLGPTMLTEFYGPYSKKLYGLSAAELTGELADRRVAATSLIDIVKKVLTASKPGGRTFWYPKHGYGQLCDRLADAAADAGVDLRLETSVDSVAVDGSSVSGDGLVLNSDVVLSSIPTAALARLVGAPSSVSGAVEQMRTRAMVLVYLTVAASQYTPFDAHYFPESDIVMSRLSESKNYRDGPDPDQLTVLCGEYACWPQGDDDVWSAADDELAEVMLNDLRRAGLPIVEVSGVHVVRLPSVYPVYEPSAIAARELVDAWAESLDGVLVFGRQGLWAPDNIHHVMAMGKAAAAAVTSSGNLDRASWNRALADFADHVVQD